MHDLLIAVLAAGSSSRLGQPKQLLTLHGEPILRRQCRIALEAQIAPVIVVLGCHAKSCGEVISDLDVTQIMNEQWREGISSSVRLASQFAMEQETNGLLILLGDQYQVNQKDLCEMFGAWNCMGRTKAYRSRTDGYIGPPVILPHSCFSSALRLRGDEGAKLLLRSLEGSNVVDFDMPHAKQDIDLPSDLCVL